MANWQGHVPIRRGPGLTVANLVRYWNRSMMQEVQQSHSAANSPSRERSCLKRSSSRRA